MTGMTRMVLRGEQRGRTWSQHHESNGDTGANHYEVNSHGLSASSSGGVETMAIRHALYQTFSISHCGDRGFGTRQRTWFVDGFHRTQARSILLIMSAFLRRRDR
jgi:hypothetical protein